MAVNEERARAEIEKLYKELEGANNRLRDYVLKIEELAITKERNRLAREIHDGLGHYLTTVHMQIQAARAVMKLDSSKSIGCSRDSTKPNTRSVSRCAPICKCAQGYSWR